MRYDSMNFCFHPPGYSGRKIGAGKKILTLKILALPQGLKFVSRNLFISVSVSTFGRLQGYSHRFKKVHGSVSLIQ